MELSPQDEKKAERIREQLAELEHIQWMKWSQTICERGCVDQETALRWQGYWIPYAELPEEVKEQDRIWADKILSIEGILIESDNQDLPDIPESDWRIGMSYYNPNFSAIYHQAQQDTLKQGRPRTFKVVKDG